MLQLRGVSRSFGEHRAVDDVSFDVPDGHMVGFVGGNGAGKTTTMRMIMGVLANDGGEILWNDKPLTTADRRTFGYMPEERGLYPKQPVLSQLRYLGELRGLSADEADASATELLGRFGLGDRTSDKLESLSLGNQQRVQVAAAVMARPKLLILDEPFSGLDPTAVDSMADLLRDFRDAGVGVLFSSHQLDLVERLCDSLVVLAKGRVVAVGNAQQLRGQAPRTHRLVTGADAGWVRELTWLTVADVQGGMALVHLADPADTDRLLAEAMRRGSVHELAEVVPTLSEIYREVTA